MKSSNRCRRRSRKRAKTYAAGMESASVSAVVPTPTTTLLKNASRKPAG